jgi:hypothetical protein
MAKLFAVILIFINLQQSCLGSWLGIINHGPAMAKSMKWINPFNTDASSGSEDNNQDERDMAETASCETEYCHFSALLVSPAAHAALFNSAFSELPHPLFTSAAADIQTPPPEA